MRLKFDYEFSQENVNTAKDWAKEINSDYKDLRLLLADALQAGVFKDEHVRIMNAEGT